MEAPNRILDVDPDADEEEVRAAYRERVKETHPDQGGSREAFQAVTAAYRAMLSDNVDPDSEWRDDSEGSTDWPVDAQVEYLNYEVIADRDWEVDAPDLFERARGLDLDEEDHGTIEVSPTQSVLEAAEECGFAWPFACRGGACANCAVKLVEGKMTQPPNTILPEEMRQRGVRLSCNGQPVSEDMQIIYNVKERPELDDLRLPPYPFLHAHASD